MKNRKLVVGLLVMLAVVMSTLTFAYWASSVTGDNTVASNTINIGTGEDITTTVVVTPGATNSKELVPNGFVVDSNNQTDSVELTFEVEWNEDVDNFGGADGVAGTLSYALGTIQVADDAQGTNAVTNPNSLVNVSVELTDGSSLALEDGNSYTVTVIITLTEPDDAAEYNSVAGKVILFDLTLSVGLA